MAEGLGLGRVALLGLQRSGSLVFFFFLKLELGTRNVYSKSRFLAFLRKQKSEENAFPCGIYC